MDKTRDEMNGNQRMLLDYLESLVVDDNILNALIAYSAFLAGKNVPSNVYNAVNSMSNAEITNVLHELTRPF